MIRAWFINELGHQFSKDFKTGDDLESFINRAKLVGTRLLAFSSIE